MGSAVKNFYDNNNSYLKNNRQHPIIAALAENYFSVFNLLQGLVKFAYPPLNNYPAEEFGNGK